MSKAGVSQPRLLEALPGYDASAPLLSVDDLYVEFSTPRGRAKAVNGATYSLQSGEMLAIVGESGSGKSMTARAIMGIVPSPQGSVRAKSIRMHGVDLLGVTSEQRRELRGNDLAMVFQDALSALNPVLTVGDQIGETLRAHRDASRSEARLRATEMLELVEIPAAARRVDDYPHEFSGGMRQRVMIAMALVLDPLLLIADEPTTALDATLQAQIIKLLTDIQRSRQMGLVLITHDLGLVAEVADRVAVTYAGRVVENASAQEIFTRPAHPYTEALLASVLRPNLKGQRLAVIKGTPPDPARLPSGCSFHPRCQYALDLCIQVAPPAYVAGPHRVSACHRWEELLPTGADEISGGITAIATPSSKTEQNVVLEVRDLVKHFPLRRGIVFKKTIGTVKSVDGLSLNLRRGETLGVVGESGCGKSTLAKLLTALERPTSGEVRILGEDIGRLSGKNLKRARRHIQLIFQDPYTSLDPRMTIDNIIREPLDVHGVGSGSGARRQRVRELLEIVGLNPDHAWRYPHQFSGGQRQRIGIARALALRPEILVCDEPVSALDVSVQAQIMNLFAELQTEFGLSYIFIAHNLSVVEHFADRVAVMYLGKVVETGTGEDIYRRAGHPYTQALLSAAPAPDPRLERQAARILLQGEVPSPVDPPSGCRFRTRCWKATSLCAEQVPELVVRPGVNHPSACHYADERRPTAGVASA